MIFSQLTSSITTVQCCTCTVLVERKIFFRNHFFSTVGVDFWRTKRASPSCLAYISSSFDSSSLGSSCVFGSSCAPSIKFIRFFHSNDRCPFCLRWKLVNLLWSSNLEENFFEELALGLESGFDGVLCRPFGHTKLSSLIIGNVFSLDGMLDDLLSIIKILECKDMLYVYS